MLLHRIELLLQASFQVRGSAISVLGDIAVVATGDDVGRILEILFTQLGSSGAPLKGLAYAQVRGRVEAKLTLARQPLEKS
jgi:hypothetical protein